MIGPQIPVARKYDLVIQELQDEILVFDTKTNKAHCLNQTAAAIWSFCDGRNTVDEIQNLLEIKTGSKISDKIVWLAIDQLNEKQLLDGNFGQKLMLENRREALKKIGLTTIIALPIVASITAPTAALAAACSGIVSSCTGCANGTPCNVNMDAMIGSCQGMGSFCSGD